jgi:hypothetical protein
MGRASLDARKEIALAMKKLSLVLAACAALSMIGCIAAPVVPPLGIIYTNIDAPLAPKGEVGSKRGVSHVTAFLGLFSTGDGSVRQAAANGNISNVQLVDYEFTNVLGIYQRYTTVVYGN